MTIWFYVAILAFDVLAGIYARRNGRNGIVWFVIGLIATPLVSWIALLILGNKSKDAAPSRSNKDLALWAAGAAVLLVFGFDQLGNTNVNGNPIVAHTRDSGAAADNTAPATSKSGLAQRFSVSNFEIYTNEYGGNNVRGMLTNNTDSQFSYVQIELNVYDADGAQLGSDLVNVNNLEPHARWKFDTPLLQEHVVDVKIKNITAF
ncbi:hypothetical protein BLA6993_03622 [Burkholderia lata]|uniref:FxLYD domain-containing protein n=1 Tax=Burkholderia lata (strain ATCC 17760 / DSM 23089 / LMG 22485 / NCIMB 9086 / R18194 / 383) TaxID=482957 RepID=UPI0014535ADA|nr:FxLYD domain-containing protein [Burkholderia lata]VWB76628.1 hypothetical protein BLA6993_03622 [Burkholderia lata]